MSRSRQLAAIMFTDIQGYTALMQQNEERAVRARDKHRRIFNDVTGKYGGRVLQYYGDGTLSIFDSALDAVKCGIEMQLGFREEPAIPVRIGIHTGDIFFSDEEIVGDSVNVASRIESLAVPGSVFLSGKVYDEIKNQESIKTTRLKAVKLKHVERPVEVYAVSNAGLVVPKPEEIQGKTEPLPASLAEQPGQSGAAQGEGDVPFLATKLFIPPPRARAVRRPRLTARLDEGLPGRLTLLSAPPGFGKTTLVSEWVSACGRPAAWLSLEERDSDLPRFLAYLVAALQGIREQTGAAVLGMLRSPQPPPAESMLTVLLNDLAAVPEPFVLVLDDYHVIDARAVDDALAFLLGHLPPQMHLVITTREDPQLPLSRLRARGQLTELRAGDLRFTPSTCRKKTLPPWKPGPKAGSPACRWRRCPCRAGRIPAALSGPSPEAIILFSTTWSKRCCSGSLDRSAAFYCRPRFLSGCAVRCATPLPGRKTVERCWKRWSATTCSSYRWMISAAGIAIITSSPMCSGRVRGKSNPGGRRSCTGGRANGTSRTVLRAVRCSTPWPPGIPGGGQV